MKQLSAFILLSFWAFRAWSAAASAVETSISNDSPWVYSAFSLATVEGGEVDKGGASYFAYNYLSAHYRIDYDQKLVFRAPFTYNSAGYDSFNQDENQPQKVGIDDVIVEYANYNLALLPGDIEVYWDIRAYLPTSQSARDQRTILDIRNEFFITKRLAPRLELEYWPQFYSTVQSQAAYENDFGTFSNTQRFRLKQRLTTWYRASYKWQFGYFFGSEDRWFHRSKANDTSRQRNGRLTEHSYLMGPAVKWAATKRISFIANIANRVDSYGFHPDQRDPIGDFWKPSIKNTEFTLLSFLSF